MIQEKRLAAFQGVRKESWNAFAPTNKADAREIFQKHSGKFMIFEFNKSRMGKKNQMAAFSSKHRMMCALYNKISPYDRVWLQQNVNHWLVCSHWACLGLNQDDVDDLTKYQVPNLPNLDDYL